jgi:hypothetical protein
VRRKAAAAEESGAARAAEEATGATGAAVAAARRSAGARVWRRRNMAVSWVGALSSAAAAEMEMGSIRFDPGMARQGKGSRNTRGREVGAVRRPGEGGVAALRFVRAVIDGPDPAMAIVAPRFRAVFRTNPFGLIYSSLFKLLMFLIFLVPFRVIIYFIII